MLGATSDGKRRLLRGTRYSVNCRHPTLMSCCHMPASSTIPQAVRSLQGSPGRSMLAILSGSVRISVPSPTGREIVLTTLKSGEVFGEIALIDGEDRTADATAITGCDLLVLDRRDFMPFLERRADLCIRFLKLLCQRLRQTDRQVEDQAFGHLDSRVAKALVRLANSVAPAGAGGASLSISQQELANLVGATRERVNKQLQIWQSAGILQLGKRLIVIPDIAAVAALA